ncbi:signal recognition particle 14 kDa protein-like [Corticium candelabrum]|uniref:signal recognition particle 14 kDa protein-like n=1 Tax=Corticium candelabrum TaxID=121492 RepID=UPI002E26BE74|nr:signal recognition particle 14 kDa protein-like [Corticium candelabrum]
MVLLENDAFLTELTRMFSKSKTSGSVFLTMKKYSGRMKPHAKRAGAARSDVADVESNKCLIRASTGRKRKISTVVSSKDVIKFQMAYANLLKANMDGLKKREKRSQRDKSKKGKATQ